VQAQVAPAPHPVLRTHRFGDHDELTSLIQGASTEFIQRAPGTFKGEFTSVFLENGAVQFAQVGLPYLCRGTSSGDRLMFILHLKPQSDYVWKGQSLDPHAIMFLPPQTEHQSITPAHSYWALVRFERAHLERALVSLSDAEPPLNSHTSRVLLPETGPFEGFAAASRRFTPPSAWIHHSSTSRRPGGASRSRSSWPCRWPWAPPPA